MHKKLLVSKYTAISQLIYVLLTRTVSIYARSKKNNCIEKKYIPLSKGKSDIKISYVSGVAFNFSESHNSQAFSIASSIASYLSENWHEDLIVQVFSPGLIYLEVSDSILADWLQCLIANRKEEKVEVDSYVLKAGSGGAVMSKFSDCVFSIQYAHARCCSLLQLAQQEKLIDPNDISSQSIPWLNSHGQLRLNHQAERRLICSLVKVVDDLEPVMAGPLKWEAAALGLVQAFESFWSACRIFGNLKTTSPELVMARVGLVMSTQSVLKFLLEDKLGLPACLVM